MTSPTEANCQIIEAFGLSPRFVRSFSLELDRHHGPIARVELYQTNAQGQKYVGDDGEIATRLATFRFVEDPTEVVEVTGLGEVHQEWAPAGPTSPWADQVSD